MQASRGSPRGTTSSSDKGLRGGRREPLREPARKDTVNRGPAVVRGRDMRFPLSHDHRANAARDTCPTAGSTSRDWGAVVPQAGEIMCALITRSSWLIQMTRTLASGVAPHVSEGLERHRRSRRDAAGSMRNAQGPRGEPKSSNGAAEETAAPRSHSELEQL